jgi:hypothetical protein
MRCIFCLNIAPGRWALTVRRVSGEVERVIEPLCPRCDRALRKAGDLGLRLKATGDRWLGGHIHGAPTSPPSLSPWMTNPKWPHEPD